GLLGDDDRLLPGYLEETVRRLDDDPALGIVFTSHYYDVAGRLFQRSRPLAEGRYDRFLPLFLRHRPVQISAALMRREVWEEGERQLPMPDGIAPDLFLFVRASLAGWPVYYIDSPLMVYRVHEGQASSSAGYVDRSIALWELFDFDDPECEQLRRRTLAAKYVSRAGARLTGGD